MKEPFISIAWCFSSSLTLATNLTNTHPFSENPRRRTYLEGRRNPSPQSLKEGVLRHRRRRGVGKAAKRV